MRSSSSSYLIPRHAAALSQQQQHHDLERESDTHKRSAKVGTVVHTDYTAEHVIRFLSPGSGPGGVLLRARVRARISYFLHTRRMDALFCSSYVHMGGSRSKLRSTWYQTAEQKDTHTSSSTEIREEGYHWQRELHGEPFHSSTAL